MAEATGLWDAESIIFNRGRSVASWTFTGRVFYHAQRPVERAAKLVFATGSHANARLVSTKGNNAAFSRCDLARIGVANFR